MSDLDATYIPPISSRTELDTYCEKLIRHAEVLIMEESEEDMARDIGFVAFYSNDLTTRTAFVSSIGVRPGSRGQGIGAVLLDRAVAMARELGMRRIMLEVGQENESALHFYKKYGFTIADSASVELGHTMLAMEIR